MTNVERKMTEFAFEEGKADYALVMTERHGNVGPELVPKGRPFDGLRLDVPYQLVTVLSRLYPYISDSKVAIVLRRCDEKALNELVKRDIIDDSRIVRIGLACTKEQVEKCRCADPVPSEVHFGEASVRVTEDPLGADLSSMGSEDRLAFWIRQFKKCNKCFGCTLTCPVCFCDDCVLEERTFTPEQGIPPGLAFHLIRSYHLADKCVECGECERSCPADIPLLTLRKMINRDMKDMFGFESGDKERLSPLLTTLDDQPLEDDANAC